MIPDNRYDVLGLAHIVDEEDEEGNGFCQTRKQDVHYGAKSDVRNGGHSDVVIDEVR